MNLSHTFRRIGLMLLIPCGLAVVGLTLSTGAVAQRPTGAAGGKKKDVGDAPQSKKADTGKKTQRLQTRTRMKSPNHERLTSRRLTES